MGFVKSSLLRGLDALESPGGLFRAGWLLVVGGLALQSYSWALVTGGVLLLGVVLGGALKKA